MDNDMKDGTKLTDEQRKLLGELSVLLADISNSKEPVYQKKDLFFCVWDILKTSPMVKGFEHTEELINETVRLITQPE